MRFTRRLIIITTLTSVLIFSICFWGFGETFTEREVSRSKENLSQQVSSIVKTIEINNQQIYQRLNAHANEEKRALKNAGTSLSDRPLSNVFKSGEFLALGEVSVNSTQNLNVDWLSTKLKAMSAQKLVSFFNKDSNSEALQVNKVYYRPMDIAEKMQLAVFSKSGNIISFGVLPITTFAHVSFPYRGSDSSLFLLGDRVYSLSHPEFQYIGGRLENHKLSEVLVDSPRVSDSFAFTHWDKEDYVGGFEIVEGTNLHVAMMVPVFGFSHFFTGSWFKFITILFLVTVISFFIGKLFFRPFEKTLAYYKESLKALTSGQKLFSPDIHSQESLEAVQLLEKLELQLNEVYDSHSKVEMRTEPNNKEDNIFESHEQQAHINNLCINVANSISGPVNALLGYLHMVKARPDHQVLEINLKKLEHEARTIKTFVEDLRSLSEEQRPRAHPLLLSDAINDVIHEKLPLLNDKGIRLHKKIMSQKFIAANPLYLDKALSYIFDFMIKSFSDQIQRDLVLNLEDNHLEATLRIETNSEQLTTEKLSDMLEPYGTSQLEGSPMLGLAVAKSIITQLGGYISVGQGARYGLSLSISWPVVSADALEEHLAKNKDSEPEVEEPNKDQVDEVLQAMNGDLASAIVENYNEEFNGAGVVGEDGFTSFQANGEHTNHTTTSQNNVDLADPILISQSTDDAEIELTGTDDGYDDLGEEEKVQRNEDIDVVAEGMRAKGGVDSDGVELDEDDESDDFIMVKPVQAEPRLNEEKDFDEHVEISLPSVPVGNQKRQLPRVERESVKFEGPSEVEFSYKSQSLEADIQNVKVNSNNEFLVEIRKPKVRLDN